MQQLRDADFPAEPYPGATPDVSFVHEDGIGRLLRPDPTRFAGWRVGDQDLDDWLAEQDAAPLRGRVPVLTYGSNRCPAKITWLRRAHRLTGPVVVLTADTTDIAAVWAAGRRARDGQRPATLAAVPDARERHSVWLATPEQVEVLDNCEGRGHRYRLARLRTGTVHTEDGALVEQPWCYLGLADIRRPLLVDGNPVRCAELGQRAARELDGVPADSDGLTADTTEGAPHPDQWPSALFSYGLLQPGRRGWPLVAPYAVGDSQPATAAAEVYDTGLGYPAMLLSPPGSTPGTVTYLRNTARLLSDLDEFEGPDYRRVRLVLPGTGVVAWAYVWIGAVAGLRSLTDSPGTC